MRQLLFVLAVLAIMPTSVRAAWQATEPATAPNLPEGPLQITITGVEGMVQVRSAADQPWKLATVGMELAEGAEIRTGPRSAARFTIGNDQVFSIDRLGVIKLLRANITNGKAMTDLGMKYGRTRYDIDSAEREHDTKVRSPSSVLAVRGTRVSIYDQPPFAPQAVSLVGRAEFRDLKKSVTFGGVGKTKINSESETPAQVSVISTALDPKGYFTGKTYNDTLLLQSQQAYGNIDIHTIGALAGNDVVKIGTLPVGRTLAFSLTWTGPQFSDLDITVISPLGEVLSRATPTTISGGKYLGSDGLGTNGVANIELGPPLGFFGQESSNWDVAYPPGKYTVKVDLQGKLNATINTLTVNDKDSSVGGTFDEQVILLQGLQLTPASPSATIAVNAPLPPSPPAAGGAKTQSLRAGMASSLQLQPSLPARTLSTTVRPLPPAASASPKLRQR